ncbi:MAG: M23 family metallopeptidase [Actinomycetota bacterium]
MPLLPLAAMWWYPIPDGAGPARIVVPDGTPVHAVSDGRVVRVDTQAVGTVVIRDDAERFHHYRRLQATSVPVHEQQRIEAGTVLGVVARPSDESAPALLYGVRDAQERWLDVLPLLVGAGDPAELDRTVAAPAHTDPLLAAQRPVTPVDSGPRSPSPEPAPPSDPTPTEQPAAETAPPSTAAAPEERRSRLAGRRPPKRSS